MSTSSGEAHAFLVISPADIDDQTDADVGVDEIWGVYSSLTAAQTATGALRREHGTRSDRGTFVDEWQGTTLVARWYFDDMGWTQL